MGVITFEEVRDNPKARSLIHASNEVMIAMGYTEHGFRHAGLVAKVAAEILTALGYADREVELARIAGFLHDMGICVRRVNHPVSGACLAYTILDEMGMDPAEIPIILGAIGNHEEEGGTAVSPVSAAVIIADKAEADRSRVQSKREEFDIHDYVNYAVTASEVIVDREAKTITLHLDIDIEFATVMQFFEIFLSRMVMCRKAAEVLGCRFCLEVNGTRLE